MISSSFSSTSSSPSLLPHPSPTRSSSSFSISTTPSALKLTRPHSVSHLFLTYPPATPSSSPFSPRKPLNVAMQWQDCTVKMEVDVPISVAYTCYSDRESVPRWLPFISSVKILEDNNDIAQMSMNYNILGQNLNYNWLVKNLQPIPNQKIHWRTMEGPPNKGAVRFYPKGPSSCLIELTMSYEVPQILVPVATALLPFVQGLLRRGLENFSTFAKDYQEESG